MGNINTRRVLRFFAEHKDEVYSVNQVANILDINYRIAYQEVQFLREGGHLSLTKRGNTNLCSFAYRYSGLIVEVEHERIRDLPSDIRMIMERVDEVLSPFYMLVLFGSYARGTQGKGSDIDICLIADQKKVAGQVERVIGLIPLPVHLVTFSSREFSCMLGSRTPNVGNEIAASNIVLKGLEQFYGVVRRAR